MWKIKKTEEIPDELPELPEPTIERVKELPSVQKYKQSIATPKVKERIQVVRELPTQPIRKFRDEDGTLVTFMTIEEALTEFMNNE